MRQLVGPLAVLNLLAAVAFVALGYLQTPFLELNARIVYTELDRAGVINVPVLNGFADRFGFVPALETDHRRVVPVAIAASALNAARGNAMAGALVALANGLVLSAAWNSLRREARDEAAARGTGEAAGADIDPVADRR